MFVQIQNPEKVILKVRKTEKKIFLRIKAQQSIFLDTIHSKSSTDNHCKVRARLVDTPNGK